MTLFLAIALLGNHFKLLLPAWENKFLFDSLHRFHLPPIQVIAEAQSRSRSVQGNSGSHGDAIWLYIGADRAGADRADSKVGFRTRILSRGDLCVLCVAAAEKDSSRKLVRLNLDFRFN